MGNELRFFLMNFLLQRILAHLVQNIFWNKRVYLGFLGAFPKAAFGWTTMVVTAAVYLEFEDPNSGISN